MRKEEEKFADSCIMEGMISFNAVVDAIESGVSDRKILKTVIDKARACENSKTIRYIIEMSKKYGFDIEYLPREEINARAIGTSHKGILVYCSTRSIPEITSDALKNKDGFYVMLNGIEDPYNFGYALRSLYASGADGVILNKRNWMSAAGVVCRSSAGASELLSSFTVQSDEEVVQAFKDASYRIVCAQLENSRVMWEGNLKKPLLLIVGGERRGLSKTLIDAADDIVRIDYGRDFPEALSAASASAILSFEVLRQNRG